MLINIKSKEKIAQLKLIALPRFITGVNEEFTLTCLPSLYWISLYNGLVSRAEVNDHWDQFVL